MCIKPGPRGLTSTSTHCQSSSSPRVTLSQWPLPTLSHPLVSRSARRAPSAPTHLAAAADFGALTFELQDVHDDQLDSMSPSCRNFTVAERDKQLQSGLKPTQTLRSLCWTMKRSRVLPELRRRMPSSLGTPSASTRSSISLGIWASPSASGYVFDNLLLRRCSKLTCLVADRRCIGPEQQNHLRPDVCLPQDPNQDVPGQRPEARG